MFNHLMNFSHRRTPKEAMGFFLAYFGFGAIIGLIFMGVYYLIGAFPTQMPDQSDLQYLVDVGMKVGARAGLTIAPVFMSILAIAILKQKGLLRHFWSWVLAMLAVLFGPFAGLILLAYLTTRDNRPPLPSE